MNNVRSLSILLSRDACLTCNEPVCHPAADGVMQPALLRQIADVAAKRGWACSIVAGKEGVPKAYQGLCEDMGAEVVLPFDHRGDWVPPRSALVFESDGSTVGNVRPTSARAILRVRRHAIGHMAEDVLALLGCFSDVSIRHPEMLLYSAEDIAAYREQLRKVGQTILAGKTGWSKCRVDCLTDGFRVTAPADCGAGDRAFIVDPAGDLYLCRAAMLAGMPSCGHILDRITLPDRHLMTRAYSLPCRDYCKATHCRRCVYLHREATREFCVPPAVECKVSHAELAVQAEMANEAAAHGLWLQSPATIPAVPLVDDPYELVRADEKGESPSDVWSQTLTYTGSAKDLTPLMMLAVVCHLYGTIEALCDFLKAGVAPSPRILGDAIATIRRETIERYRACTLVEGCPPVVEIDDALCGKCRSILAPAEPGTGEGADAGTAP